MDQVPVRKVRKKVQYSDLTPKDLALLARAHSLTDEQFLCFGKSYFRLEPLGLISDESKITFQGRVYLHELSIQEKKKKVVK